MYTIDNYKNTRYIRVNRLTELGLKHCFTTKDLNMRIESTSRKNGNIDNYFKTLEYLNIDNPNIFLSKQKHTDKVEIINSLNKGYKNSIGRIIPNNDGLLTNLEKVCLISQYADCTPIILFDYKNKVHANIHSGWRGTLSEISQNALEKMINNYKSDPKNIIAVLGPSISKDDFEVEYDVAKLFKDKFKKLDDFIFQKNKIKYLIDLNMVNTHILLKNGLLAENIINIDLSTYSNDLFHSYRRNKENYGLMALFTCI